MPYSYRSDVRLSLTLKQLESFALSHATHGAYTSGAKAFLNFTAMYNLPKLPVGLPICNEEVLRYFVGHCVVYLHLAYSTVKLYLSAIRHLYISHGLSNPLFHPVTGEPLHQLTLLCRGIKKAQPKSTITIRQPMTLLHLNWGQLNSLNVATRKGLHFAHFAYGLSPNYPVISDFILFIW